MGVLAVLAIAFVVVSIVCAVKESKVTGLYKTFGVYGRFKAYIALDFVGGGLATFLIAIISLVNPSIGFFTSAVDAFVFIALGVVLFLIGVLIYWRTWSKCPEMLKSRCVISMIITGLGVAMKLCVFFFVAVWKVAGPKEIVTSHGVKGFVYKGEVYDEAGNHIGVVSDVGQMTADREYAKKHMPYD